MDLRDLLQWPAGRPADSTAPPSPARAGPSTSPRRLPAAWNAPATGKIAATPGRRLVRHLGWRGRAHPPAPYARSGAGWRSVRPRTRLRPARLAAYSARSAARSNSSSLSASPRYQATPMLAVTVSVASRYTIGQAAIAAGARRPRGGVLVA